MGKKKFRPPKGFRDFPPDIMLLRKEVLSRIERVFQRYGFDPIETPILEYWEVMAGKYGEEAENKLMWRFKDPWSDRWYALRYDLTVPLARYLATHSETPLPFKRYHIGPVWRHEDPQRGRYREFYQCDVDIVGSPYPEADAEIINVIDSVMKEFNFSNYVIRLSDRRILKAILEIELGLKDSIPIYRAIDKLDKIGLNGVKGLLLKSGLSPDDVGKIIDIISIEGSNEEVLNTIESKYGSSKLVKESLTHLRGILEFVEDESHIKIDLSLVRGLDYYTGPIHETVVSKPKIGSLSGGGRYDDLLEMFLGKKVPATGGSIGVERLIDAGIELGVFKLSKKTITQVYVVVMNEECMRYALDVVKALRNAGINTSFDVTRSKEEKQRKYAKKLNIPILIFIGDKEVSNNTVTIYVRERNERLEVKKESMIKEVKKYIP